MQINTTARHCELDPAVRQFAERRLERLERLARDIREAHLVVSAEKYRHTAEITLRLTRHEIVSREESTDAHAAIDRAAAQLEAQLRRLKERRADHRQGTGRSGDGLWSAAAPEEGPDAESSPGED
jgi:putative sigma-54 modulation protein